MRKYLPVLIWPVLIWPVLMGLAGCGSEDRPNPGDLITFASTGTRTQVDCAEGKTLDVPGSNNTLAVTGRCSSVSVGGADNTITLARVDGQLTVEGLNNTITYREGDPEVDDAGEGNRISRAGSSG